MEERNDENNGVGMEIKDSHTFSIKETKQMIFRNVPEDLFNDFRDFCRNYARGSWTRGLQLALDAGKMVPMLNAISENTNAKYAELSARIDAIENKAVEPVEKKRTIKTFGGKNE